MEFSEDRWLFGLGRFPSMKKFEQREAIKQELFIPHESLEVIDKEIPYFEFTKVENNFKDFPTREVFNTDLGDEDFGSVWFGRRLFI